MIKYKLKYALEETDPSIISEAQKKQLRQVEYISKNITRAYWVYAPIDIIATLLWLTRKSGSSGSGKDFVAASLGKQSYRQRTPLVALLLTARLFGLYHLSAEMSQKYLLDNATPLLRKSDPMKDTYLEQMKQF